MLEKGAKGEGECLLSLWWDLSEGELTTVSLHERRSLVGREMGLRRKLSQYRYMKMNLHHRPLNVPFQPQNLPTSSTRPNFITRLGLNLGPCAGSCASATQTAELFTIGVYERIAVAWSKFTGFMIRL